VKRYYTFLVCLLISFGGWAVFNFAQNYSSIVNVQIVARSNVDGYSQQSTSAATVSAQCRSTGFKLASLSNRGKKPHVVEVAGSDLIPSGDDYFTLPSHVQYKYYYSIFGGDVTVEKIISGDVGFKFEKENSKKVPVRATQSIECRPQYMAVGSMTVYPDSVTIYGKPELLSTIDQILTSSITNHDVHDDLSGMVKLEKIRGVRTSVQQVHYSLAVSRYIELSRELPVSIVNNRSGKELSVYPSSANLKLYCFFPMSQDPYEKVSLFVDFTDFSKSINGKCVVQCSGAPSSVISWELDPQVCDCFEIVD